ncbi:hypothetical protein CHS0354_009025 [Potamilus streckersoni]|uniref:Uncharacterized protein n=1 Tax=Potamilus streckersoni TaxID=2493646 RepID=A0AAE0TIJ9_9BIVA|nr:hypothetical protein CHS0354_009025 [Potamilus streckersoni]
MIVSMCVPYLLINPDNMAQHDGSQCCTVGLLYLLSSFLHISSWNILIYKVQPMADVKNLVCNVLIHQSILFGVFYIIIFFKNTDCYGSIFSVSKSESIFCLKMDA